ncbi:Phage lysin, glycosyl hydrolase, family 25 [Streptococcus acidominimus]|uniref:Phage lysin, glycosyl hydrolase, family 25 n=1 Tax=Streptococcus acidominimus TaxID=1326 RepID=A0A239XB53_STRAI|nr:glycoside hydrolase family 25 protein [Streptococcus acidominimus]SNV43570.1 Phage lysin, glycosyl hydrolase, family 25 [Streptococcus acidominimus]
MRKRIKPIVVFVFLGFVVTLLIATKLFAMYERNVQLTAAKNTIPTISSSSQKNKTTSSTQKVEEITSLDPIIDISGWQLPEEMDYDTLSENVSGVIVRVFGGSGIGIDNNATNAKGVDKSYKKHIEEFQKRDVPVAVYAYVMGKSVKEMREEARILYEKSSPYKPTYYWLDVEEKTMTDMDKGVEAFRQELEKLGAKNIGIYIGTYFMEEHSISTAKFDAIWFPTYGTDSGYYEEDPRTDLDYDLHQYTSQGYVEGFNEVLDLNRIASNKSIGDTYEKLFGQRPSKKAQE